MSKKDTYHHGDLRQQIIDEALTWIEGESIVSLSLRGIARRLGVSHNAPYRHFPDKESLLVAIAETGFQKLCRALQQASKSNLEEPQKRLEAIGVAYIQYAVANSAYYRVMFSDRQLICGRYPELEQISQAAFTVLLNAIEAGQKSQIFIPGDPLQLARICWSMTHGVSMLAIDNQFDLSDDRELLDLARMATSTVSKGLLKK